MKAEVDGTITKWHWGEWIRDPDDPLNKWIRIKIGDKMNITGVFMSHKTCGCGGEMYTLKPSVQEVLGMNPIEYKCSKCGRVFIEWSEATMKG